MTGTAEDLRAREIPPKVDLKGTSTLSTGFYIKGARILFGTLLLGAAVATAISLGQPDWFPEILGKFYASMNQWQTILFCAAVATTGLAGVYLMAKNNINKGVASITDAATSGVQVIGTSINSLFQNNGGEGEDETPLPESGSSPRG